MAPVLETMPKTPFVAPAGIRMVTIDRRSGKRVYGVWPGTDLKPAVIWEAFKPETEPRRSIRKEEAEAQAKVAEARAAAAVSRARQRSDSDFLEGQGGIY
jgi:penicillin-binding protein 1A